MARGGRRLRPAQQARRVPLGADHRVIAEARLAARTHPLRLEGDAPNGDSRYIAGVPNEKLRWAAAASKRALAQVKVGDVVRLRRIESPETQVTLRVERVNSKRSTALTGTVIDASPEAFDLHFDLARGFYSFFWEPVPSAEDLSQAA